MSDKKRAGAIDGALKAAFQRLEARPIPEHLKVVIDQLDGPDEITPSPSPPQSPEP
ncbi:MAG: hypothetical protein AB1942_15700 [Pseudomonadota bacterium]